MKKLLIFLPLLVVSLACSTMLPWTTDTTATTSSMPTVVAFSATPAQIAAGQSATLMWNVTNATSVQIDQGVGSGLALAGTVTVTPSATTTYMLTASGNSGTTTATTVVTVTSSSSPPPSSSAPLPGPAPALRPNILVFDISPNKINIPPGAGPHQATMRWDVRNAAAVYINGSPVALSGSRILTPGIGVHTFTLRAVNPAGEDTRTQVLHVTP